MGRGKVNARTWRGQDASEPWGRMRTHSDAQAWGWRATFTHLGKLNWTGKGSPMSWGKRGFRGRELRIQPGYNQGLGAGPEEEEVHGMEEGETTC